jgi:hypothetical protein
MDENLTLTLTGAGNTDYLAQLILEAKGYELILDYHLPKHVHEFSDIAGTSCYAVALKDQRKFFGENFLEVLGLVTLWENRGDDWMLKDDEYVDRDLRYRAFDWDGNLLQDVPRKGAG